MTLYIALLLRRSVSVSFNQGILSRFAQRFNGSLSRFSSRHLRGLGYWGQPQPWRLLDGSLALLI